MSAWKRRVNRDHPDCAEYTEKFNALWNEYVKIEAEEKAKYPDYRGQDHPADVILRPLYRKLSADIKALQEEYSYLFVEEE